MQLGQLLLAEGQVVSALLLLDDGGQTRAPERGPSRPPGQLFIIIVKVVDALPHWNLLPVHHGVFGLLQSFLSHAEGQLDIGRSLIICCISSLLLLLDLDVGVRSSAPAYRRIADSGIRLDIPRLLAL